MTCGCGCGGPTTQILANNQNRGEVKGEFRKFIKGHASRLRGRTADGKRICFRCKQAFPESFEFFGHSRRTSSGFNPACKACCLAMNRERIRKNPERARASWRARANKHRTENPTTYRKSQKAYGQRLKHQMIEAYGGKCTCCGEAEPAFLTIEHTKGDGKAHRAACGASEGVWRDLRRRGWPKDGYTVFCFNCNIASARGRTCPHQKARVTP